MARQKKKAPPRHKQVEDALLKEIEKGAYNAHDEFLSQYAVCEKYNISLHTARKSLASLVNKGLIYKIPGKGTFIAPRSRHDRILIVYYLGDKEIDSKDFYIMDFLVGALHASNKTSFAFEPLIIEARNFLSILPDIRFVYPSIAGVVFFRIARFIEEAREHLDALQIPYAFYGSNTHARELIDVPVFWHNEERIVYTALNYLYEKGHREIAIVFGDEYPVYYQRYRTYIAWLDGKGLPVNEAIVFNTFTLGAEAHEAAAKVLREKIIRRKDEFTAVFCVDDYFAISVLRALHETEFRVPDDIAIIGVNNSPYCEKLVPSLTSIEMPIIDDAKLFFEAFSNATHVYPVAPVVFGETPVRVVERETT